MAEKKVNRKLILFDLRVSQALQYQETTRVEIEPHSEPQTDEGVTEQELCVQEISSATTLQITITSTKEKAQDIPDDEKLETVIPGKETVDAGTNNPVINTEVKNQQQTLFNPPPQYKDYKGCLTLFFEQMQETNEYADLEDQELQTTTSEEVRLQSSDTNEVQSIISIFIKQEEEASESTGIDIQQEKLEDNTRQGELEYKQ